MPTLLPPFEIHQPQTLQEASEMLGQFGEDGCAYAGGTELLLAMKQGGLRYGHLVDLKTIPGLDTIQENDGELVIGALATHLALERSSRIARVLPVLVTLERQVANIRVRATGTLGGNLCFGEPHSDPATMLLCLDARVRVVGPSGARDLPLQDFLVGSYEVALNPGEVLESISVPVQSPAQRASYQKFQVHEYPMLGLGLMLELLDATTIATARVAVGSVSPTPRRSPVAEQLLVGELGAVSRRLDEAADALAGDADLLDDAEGTADYKRHLIHVFLRRAFDEASQSK
jgi:aerobic carbon-monoxide dehydrogenase medium subunit